MARVLVGWGKCSISNAGSTVRPGHLVICRTVRTGRPVAIVAIGVYATRSPTSPGRLHRPVAPVTTLDRSPIGLDAKSPRRTCGWSPGHLCDQAL